MHACLAVNNEKMTATRARSSKERLFLIYTCIQFFILFFAINNEKMTATRARSSKERLFLIYTCIQFFFLSYSPTLHARARVFILQCGDFHASSILSLWWRPIKIYRIQPKSKIYKKRIYFHVVILRTLSLSLYFNHITNKLKWDLIQSHDR